MTVFKIPRPGDVREAGWGVDWRRISGSTFHHISRSAASGLKGVQGYLTSYKLTSCPSKSDFKLKPFGDQTKLIKLFWEVFSQ